MMSTAVDRAKRFDRLRVRKKSPHLIKQLKATRRNLVYLKNLTKNAFEGIAKNQYSEERGKELAEMVANDLQVVSHVDALLLHIDGMLGQTTDFKYSRDLYELTGPAIRLTSGQTINVEAGPDGVHIS